MNNIKTPQRQRFIYVRAPIIIAVDVFVWPNNTKCFFKYGSFEDRFIDRGSVDKWLEDVLKESGARLPYHVYYPNNQIVRIG